MATVGNLPEEMMIEILSRLPPDSLSRSKSVCNYWYALINSLQHKNVLLLRTVRMHFGKNEYIFSILKFPLDLDRPVSVLDFDFPFDDDFKYLEIHGHSHGLVCLSDRTDIFLCNPTIREFRKLPPSILLLTERPCEPYGRDSTSRDIGFGYNVKSRDFKVIRAVDFTYGCGHFSHQRLEIYDLSNDRWREFETPVCSQACWTPSFEMYHEGTYYWWANAEGDVEIIQSFDMSEEIFGQISVPESFEESCEKLRSMGVLNGSIVLFHYTPEGNEKTFDIWEMEKNELGVVSWSKLLTIISPVSGIEIDNPLLFVSSDELLMEAKGQLILYNIITQQIKTQPIKELPIKVHQYIRGHGDMEATSFVENWLSIERSYTARTRKHI